MNTNRAPRPFRPFITVAGVAALGLLLAACGDDDAFEAGQLGSGPVSVGSSSGSTTTTPSGSGSPDASSPTGSIAPPASGATSAPPEPVIDTNAELDLDDQSGDGSGVQVSEVYLSGGSGHVAIFTRAGELLGSAPVSAAARPVTVTLSTPVPTTSELVAVLYADDGDGQLDITRDPRIADDDGEFEDDDFDYRLQ